jgi:peptidoglycan/xylan/chitin deacetylase (PgdA/CDA1 family)
MKAEAALAPRLRLPYLTPWALKFGEWTNRHCLWRVPTQEKVVALTFDDGPSLRYMPSLLASLRQHNLRATFFVLGSRIDDTRDGRRRFDLLMEASRDGHEIAVHGETHRSLFGMPDEKIQADLATMRKRLDALPGNTSRFFRPPFGHVNGRISKTLASAGFTAVNASILPGDSFLPKGWEETPDRSTLRILRDLHPGTIVCLHVGEDIGIDDAVFPSPHAAEIVKKLMPELSQRGYRVATLSELIPY